MKKLLCALALVLCGTTAAQAQVYFGPGSDKPLNPGAATRDIGRQHHAHAPVTPRHRLVRCKHGSKRLVRMCRRNGGIVRH